MAPAFCCLRHSERTHAVQEGVLWDVSVHHTVRGKCMWGDFISQSACVCMCVCTLLAKLQGVMCSSPQLNVTSSLNPQCPQTHINPPSHTHTHTLPNGAADRELDEWLHQYEARLQWIKESCNLMKPSTSPNWTTEQLSVAVAQFTYPS